MSENSNSLNDYFKTYRITQNNKDIQQTIHDITVKYDKQKINFDVKFDLPTEKIKTFIETRNNLQHKVSELFPSVDAERFINYVTYAPLKGDYLDMSTLIKLFFNLEVLSTMQTGQADLPTSITVAEPEVRQEPLTKKSYVNLIMEVFTVVTFAISQFQNVQTTEQLNRIEDKIIQLIEQQDEVEYEQDYILELPEDDISPGIRT